MCVIGSAFDIGRIFWHRVGEVLINVTVIVLVLAWTKPMLVASIPLVDANFITSTLMEDTNQKLQSTFFFMSIF